MRIVPRLWTETIDSHRHAVREAVLDVTAALVNEKGVRAATMSEIAERAGIGRATLYKYFPDVDAILRAWHERHVAGKLARLEEIVDGREDADPLKAVLTAYAFSQTHSAELPDLHSGQHVDDARDQLLTFMRRVIADAMASGRIRDDVPAPELASYCLHALGAAQALRSHEAVLRLVGLTIAALNRPS